MGAKRLYTTFWQPSDLKTDADIPAQADITIGAGYLDCKNISLSAVRVLVGAPAPDLYSVCNLPGTFVAGGESGKINAWARYKPGMTAYDVHGMLPDNCYDNPSFTYTPPGTSGARLGDFAGYNHSEATRPVYWGAPHQSEQYVVYGTWDIRGGLQRGRLCPLLGSGPEDETLWSRVKVQAWLKVGSGAYSLISTSGYIDLSEPTGDTATLLFTMGDHGEVIGTNYTLCLRPVYMDEDGETPLAVCEGGVEILTYRKWGTEADIAAALSITLNDVDTIAPDAEHHYTRFTYDFNLNNLEDSALTLAIRLRAEDNDAWFTETYLLTSEVTIPEADYENFVEATGLNLPSTLYDGTFKLGVEVSVDGGTTWIHVGYLGTTLQHWQSIP
jgi:hypothetical protein